MFEPNYWTFVIRLSCWRIPKRILEEFLTYKLDFSIYKILEFNNSESFFLDPLHLFLEEVLRFALYFLNFFIIMIFHSSILFSFFFVITICFLFIVKNHFLEANFPKSLSTKIMSLETFYVNTGNKKVQIINFILLLLFWANFSKSFKTVSKVRFPFTKQKTLGKQMNDKKIHW